MSLEPHLLPSWGFGLRTKAICSQAIKCTSDGHWCRKTQKEIRPSHSHCLYCCVPFSIRINLGGVGREGRGRERGEPETQELEWRDRAEKGDRDRGERGKEIETRKINGGKRGESQKSGEGRERKKGREQR